MLKEPTAFRRHAKRDGDSLLVVVGCMLAYDELGCVFSGSYRTLVGVCGTQVVVTAWL